MGIEEEEVEALNSYLEGRPVSPKLLGGFVHKHYEECDYIPCMTCKFIDELFSIKPPTGT